MLPVRDIIPTRTAPLVAIVLIALNVLVFSAVGATAASVLWFPMFLHGSALELAVNMVYLWIFGGSVEDRLGHGRFAAFYLLCGISGAFAQAYLGAGPVFGASGAVAGVLGRVLRAVSLVADAGARAVSAARGGGPGGGLSRHLDSVAAGDHVRTRRGLGQISPAI